MTDSKRSISHLYCYLFILIGIAFLVVNIVGYGLKRSFFPTHLKEGIIEDFLFPIKLGDIDHAIELLSPRITVLHNSKGEKIGIASDGHSWSFGELSLCEGGMNDKGSYILNNGAIIEVSNRSRILIRAGDKVFPWNEKTYSKRNPSEKISITANHIRDNIDDNRCWLFGISELARTTGKDISPEPPPSKDERLRILEAIQANAHD